MVAVSWMVVKSHGSLASKENTPPNENNHICPPTTVLKTETLDKVDKTISVTLARYELGVSHYASGHPPHGGTNTIYSELCLSEGKFPEHPPYTDATGLSKDLLNMWISEGSLLTRSHPKTSGNHELRGRR